MSGTNFKSKINEFLSDRKYSNNLLEILSILDVPKNVTPKILLGIQRLFGEVLKKQTMYMDKSSKGENSAAEEAYKSWLRDCYSSCFTKLMNVLSNGDSESQIQAIVTFMHLLQQEGKHPINPSKLFPEEKLTLIIKHIVMSPFCSIFIERFKEYFCYKDIVFYCFKSIAFLVSNGNFLRQEEIFTNTMNFLKEMPVSSNREKQFPANIVSEELFCSKKNIKLDLKVFCSSCTKIWETFAGYKNQTHITMKLLLITLIDKLMHYHLNPILITDFLISALSFKGPIAVLSLQGIVNLVRQYNLEYPNIYDKLYNLLEPNIFCTKYKARLFYLTDLLMMSTHLPEALVASFIKRLSRLSLTAPPQDIAIMIYLIGNLIMRHKGLIILFQNSDVTLLEEDPFDAKQTDPFNTNALKSSLWEIKILQNHPLYTVHVPARFINNPLPNVEWDLGKYLEVTYDHIFTQENKKKQKEISTNFERPNSMFQCNTNDFFNHFVLV